MIKKIIFSFALFLVFNTYVFSAAAPLPLTPTPTSTINLPFPASGLNCGVPNSKANKCCASSSSFLITNDDIDAIIKDISDGDGELSPQSFDQLATLYLVNNPDSNLEDIDFLAYIGTVLSIGKSQNQASLNRLRNGLRASANKLKNLSGGELLVLQVKKTYPEDKCIIDIGIGKAFCTRGISEFFAGMIGDNPNFQSILKSSLNTPQEKCLFGKADTKGSSCICEGSIDAQLCNDYLSNTKEYGKCADCMLNKKGVWTGVGCIRTGSAAVFIQDVLFGWGIGLAGLIALICIIYSAFLLQTSQGNPERIKKAREYLTNCIIGLLLIIFAIFILRLIGVNILQIPGFGS